MEEGYCSIESKIRGVVRVLACPLGPFRLPPAPVAASPLASRGHSQIPGRSVSAILQPPGSFLLQIHSIYRVYSPGNAGYARAYPVAPSLIRALTAILYHVALTRCLSPGLKSMCQEGAQ